jgi:hypothetical protein
METTNRLDGEPEYQRCIHRLRSLCSQWRDDNSFVLNGGTIYLAVDVDVIDMFLNPSQNDSYGEILGRDSKTGQLVARLMGDSIFLSNFLSTKQGLNTPNVLLLIPPHDQELLYHLWGIARRVQAGAVAVSEPTFRELDSIVEQYNRDRAGATADLPDAVNNFLKNLVDHVPQLVALFDEAEGDAAALKQFSRVDSARLLNIFNLRRNDGKYFILRPEEEIRDEISDLINEWEARLTPHSSEKQMREALATDAQVLATIQYINNTLCSPVERLMLITGSRYLFKAMETSDAHDLSKDEIAFRKDFLSQYLRHPQWIMSNRNFFQTTQGEETTNAGTGAKDSSLGQRPLGLERILELMAPLDGGGPLPEKQDVRVRIEGFAQVQESWNAEIKALVAARFGPALDKAKTVGAIKLAKLIIELQRTGTWSVRIFKKKLLDNASQLMNTLFLDSSSLGLLDILAEPSRMMPALRFDRQYEEFNLLYKDLLPKMIGRGSPGLLRNSSEIRDLIAAVNKDCNGGDRDSYHVHIIHAAAFAARGHWRQVLTHCDIAIQIANGLLDEARAKSLDVAKAEYRKGREAAYLAAIARRRSARGSGDLDTAKLYLDLAEERVNEGDPPDLRFESERAAISIRRMYFKYLSEQKHLVDKEREDVYKEVRVTIDALKSIINRSNSAFDSTQSTSVERDVANWILRQCLTNLADLALIRSDLDNVSIQEYGLDQLFSEFRNSIKEEDQFCDHHAWLVSKVVDVLFNLNEQITDVLEEISKSKKDNKPMPYETKRLELYERLIKENAKL